MGYNQHDSQELATYLLDALHANTNLVLKRTSVENSEQGKNELDKAATEKTWDFHLKHEDSIMLESCMGTVKDVLNVLERTVVDDLQHLILSCTYLSQFLVHWHEH